MRTPQHGLVAMGVMLTMGFLAFTARGELCTACRERMFTADVGKCVECGKPTASGAFKLCKECSARLKQCEACRAPLPTTAAGTIVPRPIEIGEGTTGRTFELVPGQELVVHLAGNPTTGYTWTLAQVDAKILAAAGEIQFVPGKSRPPRVGQGGEFLARLTAQAIGETPVVFEYRRPWEKEPPAAKRFALTVRVKAAGKIASSPGQ